MNTLSAPLDGRRDLEVISPDWFGARCVAFFIAVAAAVSLADGRVWQALPPSGVTMTVFLWCLALARPWLVFWWIALARRRCWLAASAVCAGWADPALCHWPADAGGRGGAGRAGQTACFTRRISPCSTAMSPARLGHAFSAHGLSANLGWACAPLLLTTLASAYGWRQAALGRYWWPCRVCWRWLAARGDCRPAPWRQPRHGGAGVHAGFCARVRCGCAFVFLFTAAAFGAIQNFVSPILHAVWPARPTAALALSVYMLGSAAGVILGGFLAQKNAHDHLIAAALGLAAVLAALLAGQWLPGWSMLPLMAGMGFYRRGRAVAGFAGAPCRHRALCQIGVRADLWLCLFRAGSLACAPAVCRLDGRRSVQRGAGGHCRVAGAGNLDRFAGGGPAERVVFGVAILVACDRRQCKSYGRSHYNARRGERRLFTNFAQADVVQQQPTCALQAGRQQKLYQANLAKWRRAGAAPAAFGCRRA